jgi:hypothetical protein
VRRFRLVEACLCSSGSGRSASGRDRSVPVRRCGVRLADWVCLAAAPGRPPRLVIFVMSRSEGPRSLLSGAVVTRGRLTPGEPGFIDCRSYGRRGRLSGQPSATKAGATCSDMPEQRIVESRDGMEEPADPELSMESRLPPRQHGAPTARNWESHAVRVDASRVKPEVRPRSSLAALLIGPWSLVRVSQKMQVHPSSDANLRRYMCASCQSWQHHRRRCHAHGRGRSLIPAASRPVTSAMRAARTSGRRVVASMSRRSAFR